MSEIEEVNYEVEYSKLTLKVQALLEKIAELTSSYENKIADFRVAITQSESEWTNRLQSIHQELINTRAQLAAFEHERETVVSDGGGRVIPMDIVPGDVVEAKDEA